MDLRILLSMLSVMCTGILQTVVSAPTASSSVPHVRTKRCSCATFLDKECVYFCHLDIIWVNTPERVVSYGLGSAPRQRRSVAPSADSHGGARCTCRRENDRTCTGFCQLDNQYRYETLPDKATLPRRGRRRRGEAPPTEAGSGLKYPGEQQGGGAAPARRSRAEGSSAAGEVEGEAAPRGERGRNPVKPHHLFGQRAGGISKA